MKLFLGLLLLCAVLAAVLGGACRNPGRAESAPPSLGSVPEIAGPAPVVLGTTLDARTGKPLANALVRGPNGVEARSDERGRFVLRGLALGAAGDLVATTESGLSGRNRLRTLTGGPLEVVVYLR